MFALNRRKLLKVGVRHGWLWVWDLLFLGPDAQRKSLKWEKLKQREMFPQKLPACRFSPTERSAQKRGKGTSRAYRCWEKDHSIVLWKRKR